MNAISSQGGNLSWKYTGAQVQAASRRGGLAC